MKFPASSNSSTGGAAMAFWSARTVLGRCRIQAWPCSSIDTLETWPHTHLLGSLAQLASTSNLGISRAGVVCAAAGVAKLPCARPMTTAPTAAMTERVVAPIGKLLVRARPAGRVGLAELVALIGDGEGSVLLRRHLDPIRG